MSFYVTVFRYSSSGNYDICSRHKTFYAADAAANRCEKKGGDHHDVWEVTEYKRKKKRIVKN